MQTLGPLTDRREVARIARRLRLPQPRFLPRHRFDAGNHSVVEWTGKNEDIHRPYRNHCRRRFTEYQVTLRRYSKLTEATVVRIVQCRTHGCLVEATADICEVDLTFRVGSSAPARRQPPRPDRG